VSDSYTTIDQPYVEGLSITYNINDQRKHIWTFAGDMQTQEMVPPTTVRSSYSPPPYIGEDYYCESGAHLSVTNKWYTNNSLWDGKGCHASSCCCDNDRQPWFWQILPEITGSDIEVHWFHPSRYNVGIEQLELYVY
jgi:hypothetical protein